MPTRSQCFIGNSFLTTLDLTSGPVWSPLEQLAASVWQRPELPQSIQVSSCTWLQSMASVRGW